MVNRSPRGWVAGTFAGVLVPVVVGCSDNDGTSGASMPWMEWGAVVEREVGAADVGPLCLVFDGEVSGTYTEFAAPDGSGAVAVFELEGDAEELDSLEALYRRLAECEDESLEIERVSVVSAASDTGGGASPVVWTVQAAVGDQVAEPELVGYASSGTRARIVVGSESTWRQLGGVDSWEL